MSSLTIRKTKIMENLIIEDLNTLDEKLLSATPDEELINQRYFQDHMIMELQKVAFFFNENYNYNLNRFEKIKVKFLIKKKDQLHFLKHNKQYIETKPILETALKELYKEANLMKGYIELNFKAKIKIMKKFKKCTAPCAFKIDLNSVVEIYMNSGILKDPIKKIVELITDIEKVFSNNFFDKYSFQTNKMLKDYISTNYFTQEQAFYFGFFVGLKIILIILCVIIGYYFNIDMDDDEEFKSIIPMFRGFFILCLFFWLLALNVYYWDKAHINYKLCFQFTNHYSDVISIFKRAAIFSAIFVLMFLCYMVIRTKIPLISDLLRFIPLELTPLICWVCLLVYIFFPLKDYFNYIGRYS